MTFVLDTELTNSYQLNCGVVPSPPDIQFGTSLKCLK